MGQILLSLSEEGEKRLRRLAKQNGGHKGAISQTVEEALAAYEKGMTREEAWRIGKALADADLDLGVGTFDRKELYKGKRFGGH